LPAVALGIFILNCFVFSYALDLTEKLAKLKAEYKPKYKGF